MDQGVETIDGVVLSWYPFDAGLPMAAELVAGGGATSLAGRSTGTVVERLAWVPRRRLVLGVGDRVVKLDADPERVALGVDTLRRLRSVPGIVVPEVIDHDAADGVFVQQRLPGRGAERTDAMALVDDAAQIVRALQGVDPAGLPTLDSASLVEACEPVMALVAFARPDLADRIEAIRTKLGSTMPIAGPLLPAHGDFNVSQLLIGPDGTIGLVDTDTLALAPVGFDLASYAANLVAGRKGDLDDADGVLEALRSAAGEPMPDLDWLYAVCLLRRLDRPIRRYKRRWSSRIDRLLHDVEVVIARLA
ncbi:MAG: aminoglycoside phosphotransferase family protein [Acidimicrobiales bacterium]